MSRPQTLCAFCDNIYSAKAHRRVVVRQTRASFGPGRHFLTTMLSRATKLKKRLSIREEQGRAVLFACLDPWCCQGSDNTAALTKINREPIRRAQRSHRSKTKSLPSGTSSGAKNFPQASLVERDETEIRFWSQFKRDYSYRPRFDGSPFIYLICRLCLICSWSSSSIHPSNVTRLMPDRYRSDITTASDCRVSRAVIVLVERLAIVRTTITPASWLAQRDAFAPHLQSGMHPLLSDVFTRLCIKRRPNRKQANDRTSATCQ